MNADTERFQRVEAIFHEVSSSPAAERAALLKRLCSGDEELLEDVQSLLLYEDAPPLEGGITQALQLSVPPPAFDINLGRHIGPYEIRSYLGGGGMGSVYLALQTEPVRRTVAIKLVRPGYNSEEMIRRFQHERQVLAALNHSNIARLLEAGTTLDGSPYLVMEYVEGEPITRFSERHQLSVEARLKLFQQVCAAVHFAHQNTVIHRDLKPANILVTPQGTLKLLDFGIAKLTDPNFGFQTQDYAQAASRFLTPAYASPEQLANGAVTTVSDVYSLGVVLYELLTGRHPHATVRWGNRESFSRSDVEPRRPSEVVRSRRAADPDARHGKGARPSRRREAGTEQLARQIRGDLDNIVLTALRSEPELRYSSAEQLSADIERHLRHEPVLAAPPSSIYRLRKFARRNPALCALFAVLVAAVIGVSWAGAQAIQARVAAEASERIALERTERLRRTTYSKEMSLASFDFSGHAISSLRRRLADVPTDLRDWEWSYLSGVSDDSFQVWRGHTAPVTCMARSADGQWIASGDSGGAIRLWNPENGGVQRVWQCARGGVASLAFTPDGKTLASAGGDGVLRLWGVAENAEKAHVSEGASPLVAVRFSPDARWVVAGRQDNTVQVWEMATLKPSRVLKQYDGRYDALDFLDGHRLLGAGAENTICMWDLDDGAELRLPVVLRAPITSLALSPDRTMLAAAAFDRLIYVYDTMNWQQCRPAIRGHQLSTCSVAWSSDGKRIASSADSPGLVRVWRTSDSTATTDFHGHERAVTCLIFSHDGRKIISASEDRTLRVWDGDPQSRRIQLTEGLPTAVRSLAFSSEGHVLITGEENGALRLFDLDAVGPLMTFKAHTGAVCSIVSAPATRRIYTGGEDGQIAVWHGDTVRPLRRFTAHPSGVRSIAVSADGKHLVSAGNDGIVRKWDPETGKQIFQCASHPGMVTCVALAADRPLIASGESDGELRLWDRDRGTSLNFRAAHQGPVRALGFSPDGRHLLSAGDDSALRIWEVEGLRLVRTLMDHDGPVLTATFSPNGRRIVSAGDDRATRLWDWETGLALLVFRRHTAVVNCVAMSPDGRSIISGSNDRRLAVLTAESYATTTERMSLSRSVVPWSDAYLEEARRKIGNDWASTADYVRQDKDISPVQRREALTRIPVHTWDCYPPAADWLITCFWWPVYRPASLPWDSHRDMPAVDAIWRAARDGPTAVQMHAPALDFDWDRLPPLPGFPREHFGLTATARITVDAGHYRLGAVSDDGVRIFIDGRKVLDDWTVHSPRHTGVEVDLDEHEHAFLVEYVQLGANARLRLCLEPMGPMRGPVTSAPATPVSP